MNTIHTKTIPHKRSAVPAALWRDTRGVAFIEVAIFLPVLVMLTLGTLDLARYILINQRMDRAAATLADLTARVEAVTETDVDQIFFSVEQVAQPFELNNDGIAILSSVVGQGGAPIIDWQRSGVGTLGEASRLGTEGGTADLPDGFTVGDGEGMVAAEIIYSYTSIWLSGLVPARELYFRTFFRPRRSLTVELE